MTEIPSRLAAALADRYRLERELGEGGMATVYLAGDLKHDRKVAIKVLRPELAAVLGAERFVQEIKTTANLQHPHILPLFDSGEADGFLYYVMPFIDGETLRHKLNRETQLGIDEAVRIATDVADALDYAHRHNVIHRDIKPENILLHDGRPTVADFGIALAVSAAAGGRMTETGLSLGTPHYMSPEQATAEKDLTNRSDIYSLGAVLYEMLTGDPPHTSASAQAIIMKIVTDDVRPVTDLRKTVPTHVADAVHVALNKLPADRFPTAHRFGEALRDPTFASSTVTAARPARADTKRWKRATTGAMGAAVLMTVLFGWALIRSRPESSSPVTRFAFAMARPGDEPWVTISPDGRRVLMVHTGDDGITRVFVRDLGSTEVVPIPGTEGAAGPFFSPDGEWIGFVSERGLRKVPAGGGAAIDIADTCDAPASWHRSGTIVCVSTVTWGLSRVSADGGTPEALTKPDTTAGEIGHWKPEILPDGNAVIFTNFRAPATNRIEAFDLGSGKRTVLIEGAVFARYSPSGHLLFVRDEALFAVPFDPRRLEVRGGPIPVVDDVALAPSLALGGFAVAPNGTLVIIKASQWEPRTQLVWVSRDGTEEKALGTPGDYMHPRISPDGRRVVITMQVDARRDLRLYDINRGALSQIRRNPAQALRAVWMPDSRDLLYTVESPSYDLYRMPIDGSSPEEALISNTRDKFAMSVSPDGALLAYEEKWGGISRIMVMRLDGNGAPPVFADTLIPTRAPAFSPNGKWIAYTGQVSGPTEVYLRAVDGAGGRRQVSVGGGELPRWTREGREIVYRRGDAFHAVSVDPESGEVGSPTVLFRGAYRARKAYVGFNDYDVTVDGNRFIVVKPVEQPGALPIVVTLNWFVELQEKFGS